MKQTINQRLKEVRENLGLSQADFAARAGISSPTIWNIENTDRETSTKTIRSIVEAFNINPEWLNSGKGDMFLAAKIASESGSEINPWKDALVTELKEEVQYLRELLKVAMGKANFPQTLNFAGECEESEDLEASQLRAVA